MRRRTILHAIALMCSLGALAPAAATAASFPDRPLRLIVPYASGGGTDILARLLSEKLGERLGQPVVVENRPGANGTIGADAVAKAPADGYTLLLGGMGPLAINATLMPKIPYDPVKAFVPIVMLSRAPFVLVAGPAAPENDLKRLLAYARANARLYHPICDCLGQWQLTHCHLPRTSSRHQPARATHPTALAEDVHSGTRIWDEMLRQGQRVVDQIVRQPVAIRHLDRGIPPAFRHHHDGHIGDIRASWPLQKVRFRDNPHSSKILFTSVVTALNGTIDKVTASSAAISSSRRQTGKLASLAMSLSSRLMSSSLGVKRNSRTAECGRHLRRVLPTRLTPNVLRTCSAGALPGPDFCFIFAPYGYDEPEILPS